MHTESSLNSPQLSHPINNENEISLLINYRPKIEITLFNNQCIALLDPGATDSAISETRYKTTNNDPSKFDIPTFSLISIPLNTEEAVDSLSSFLKRACDACMPIRIFNRRKPVHRKSLNCVSHAYSTIREQLGDMKLIIRIF